MPNHDVPVAQDFADLPDPSGRYFIASEGNGPWCARDREAPADGRARPFSP